MLFGKEMQPLIAVALLLLCLGSASADQVGVITEEDRNRLNDIYEVFKKEFDKENTKFKQFAVLYYGGPNVGSSITNQCKSQAGGHTFLTEKEKNYNVSICDYIASRLTETDPSMHAEFIIHNSLLNDPSTHTELIIYNSLLNDQRYTCPKPSGHMYLVSHNTPCTYCVRQCFKYFAEACCSSEHKLIIGYTKEYQQEESYEAVTEIPNVAMTRIRRHYDEL